VPNLRENIKVKKNCTSYLTGVFAELEVILLLLFKVKVFRYTVSHSTTNLSDLRIRGWTNKPINDAAI
jgi:hypothetical protein